jgi:hypothetical protein
LRPCDAVRALDHLRKAALPQHASKMVDLVVRLGFRVYLGLRVH